MKIQTDARWVARALVLGMGILVGMHVVAVGGGLRGAEPLDIRSSGAVARWAMIALLLLAAGLAALLVHTPALGDERRFWRLFGWVATVLSLDAVISLRPWSSFACRMSLSLNWALAGGAAAAGAALLAHRWRSEPMRLRSWWIVSLGALMAGQVLGGSCADASVVGRLLCLIGAGAFVVIAARRIELLDGADAHQQLAVRTRHRVSVNPRELSGD